MQSIVTNFTRLALVNTEKGKGKREREKGEKALGLS
jgi:hypothetical protein